MPRKIKIKSKISTASRVADPFSSFSCIVSEDMPRSMSRAAVRFALEALERFEAESEVASHIKARMEEAYRPQFHVVVGRSFGCSLTYEVHTFLELELRGYKIVIFKAG